MKQFVSPGSVLLAGVITLVLALGIVIAGGVYLGIVFMILGILLCHKGLG